MKYFCILGISNAAETVVNCTEKAGTNACYTCMGRDMENCETGTVCCSGACFKLIDEKHNLIMKGCTNEDQEDGSMKRRTFDIRLYWAKHIIVKEAIIAIQVQHNSFHLYFVTFCSVYLPFYHFLNHPATTADKN
uniref:TIL domain-containing protein n=1 Tax=Elaeophora elaphi TaxID=1147741 RepID=A0A0R3S106_9BILA